MDPSGIFNLLTVIATSLLFVWLVYIVGYWCFWAYNYTDFSHLWRVVNPLIPLKRPKTRIQPFHHPYQYLLNGLITGIILSMFSYWGFFSLLKYARMIQVAIGIPIVLINFLIAELILILMIPWIAVGWTLMIRMILFLGGKIDFYITNSIRMTEQFLSIRFKTRTSQI